MNLNATILGQACAFIFFVWFCMKYIWPPIILAIETRQKEIKASLMDAQKAREELDVIRKTINQEIEASKAKALTIINEANKQQFQILEIAKNQAIEESKKIFIKKRENLEIEIIEIRKNLHNETVDLAIKIAEKIIQKNLQKNDYKDVIKDLSTTLIQAKHSCLY